MTPALPDPTACRPGFTLLELLIAITLLAMLSVMLMGGLRLGTRVWERSAAVGERVDDLRIAGDFLQASLGAAYPLLDLTDPTNPVLRFSGERDGLRYLAPMPEALGAAGMAQVDLRLVRGADGAGNLVIDVRHELAFADAAPLPTSLLLEGVQSVEIGYYGAEERGQKVEWRDAWHSKTWLPQLIRIRVTFPVGDERAWPELMVAPRVMVEATCRYDALRQDCLGR
jgi:general secretion pathway protein J